MESLFRPRFLNEIKKLYSFDYLKVIWQLILMEKTLSCQLASWILKNYKGKDLTQLKLQKLVFYSYCINNALGKDPFEEVEFEAWMYGPVNVEVRESVKHYGRSPIPQNHFVGFEFVPTSNQEQVLKAVLNTYGRISPTRLIEQTHRDFKETSWGNGNQKLDPQKIIKFYSNLYTSDEIKAPEMLFNALSFEIDNIETNSFKNFFEMAEFFGEV